MKPVRTGIRKRVNRPAHSGTRLLFYENLFDSSENLPGLFHVQTGSHATIVIRFWIIKVLKENLRHLRVIVLAGVDKDPGMIFPDLLRNRSTLDNRGRAPTMVTVFKING